MSYATLNIFLNSDFTGGETTFYEKDSKTKNMYVNLMQVEEHFFILNNIILRNKILTGYKYLLRTDLMINHNK